MLLYDISDSKLQEELKFEIKFKIPGVGAEIPTLEEIEFLKESSLVL